MSKLIAGGLIVTLMVLTVWANVPHSSLSGDAPLQLNESVLDAYSGGSLFGCLLAIAAGVKAIIAIITGVGAFAGAFWLSAAIVGILEAC